ncbi:hypothetical protein B0T21DRAFT_385668 [Apiosordaria backusii]|uniref:Uncharacterized protein n=1 Tax=Apiosordaria backusii TaxID=314023 RepID=A0AA40B2D4_9PEZI|nr:hypothetical protein B0T21DRAFT_385668 [Apiosordaria backusii]
MSLRDAYFGYVGQAASVIAKIAGVPVKLHDDDDPAAQLFPNFTTASSKVYDAAEKGAKEKLEEVLAALPDHIKNDSTLETTSVAYPAESTFLWTDPAPLNKNGKPNRELVQDIGKMLAQRGFPTVFPTSTSDADSTDFDWLDVALNIGKAIFSNIPPITQDSGDGITTSKFAIHSGNGSWITGCHAYYGIPLGQAGANSAWHSGLVMQLTTTKAYRDFETARNKALNFTQDVSTSNGKLRWLVTMNVQWEGSVTANRLAPALKGKLKSDDIKLQCPDEYTPAQARGLVRECAKSVIQSLFTGTGSEPYLTPEIIVTMSTLL